MKPHELKPGLLVRHSAEFCKSIAWHTPPVNGIVIRVGQWLPDQANRVATIWWSDEKPGIGHKILASNLELHPANTTLTDSNRGNHLAEFIAAERKQ